MKLDIPSRLTILKAILHELKTLFENMKVTNSNSKLVSFSKTLHFLLPNLVMPMDRANTLPFFKCEDLSFNGFKKIFLESKKIAGQL